MKKTIKFICAATLAVAVSGCLSSAVTFAPSSVPMGQGKYTELAQEVTGTSLQVSWLFCTFGAGGSGQRHALDDALSRTDGADGLVSMAVDEEKFIFVPVAFPVFIKTRVTGTPVKLNAQ